MGSTFIPSVDDSTKIIGYSIGCGSLKAMVEKVRDGQNLMAVIVGQTNKCTLKEWCDAPNSDASLLHKLAQRYFQEKDGNASNESDDDIWDEEHTCIRR